MPYEIVDVPEAQALVASATCAHSQLGPVIGEAFGGLMQRYPDAELIDAPRIYYRRWAENDCDIDAAAVIDPASVPGAHLTTYPACRAVMSTHVGPYDGLADAWMQLWAEVQAAGLQPAASPPWDSYVTDPGEEPDSSQWVTEIYIPIE